MDHNICHFELPADDTGALRSFYSKLFAWTIEPAPGLGDDYLFIRTSQQAGVVSGGLLKRSEAQPALTVYFTVEDVVASAKKLEELGGKVVVPKCAVPKLGWAVVGRDPAGNTVGLFQEDPTAA
jgi:uncharacterized protein